MPFKSHILQDQLLRWTMSIPERDYYKVPYSSPKPPKPGYVLLVRRPQSPAFRVIWTAGQAVSILGDDPRVLDRLLEYGITKELAEKSLQHIWNFGEAYVKLKPGSSDSPPVIMPKNPLSHQAPIGMGQA